MMRNNARRRVLAGVLLPGCVHFPNLLQDVPCTLPLLAACERTANRMRQLRQGGADDQPMQGQPTAANGQSGDGRAYVQARLARASDDAERRMRWQEDFAGKKSEVVERLKDLQWAKRLDGLQAALDVLEIATAFVPVYGLPISAALSLANGAISLSRGNYLDAGVRVGFSLPGVMATGKMLKTARLARGARMAGSAADDVVEAAAVRATKGLNGAPKRVNLNRSDAIGHFGVYEVRVNGRLWKMGKADLGRVTKSSGLPTRLHQQVRRLEKAFGKGNVIGKVVEDLGETTTALAKHAEHARLLETFRRTGIVLPGNMKSFRP